MLLEKENERHERGNKSVDYFCCRNNRLLFFPRPPIVTRPAPEKRRKRGVKKEGGGVKIKRGAHCAVVAKPFNARARADMTPSRGVALYLEGARADKRWERITKIMSGD